MHNFFQQLIAMASALATVYYSPRCPNCTRFIDGLRRSPSARESVNVVNIDTTAVRGVDFVPTVVLSDGQVFVGTKAFEWLREHVTDTDLAPAASASGLAFSDLSSSGHAMYAEAYSQFIPPE